MKVRLQLKDPGGNNHPSKVEETTTLPSPTVNDPNVEDAHGHEALVNNASESLILQASTRSFINSDLHASIAEYSGGDGGTVNELTSPSTSDNSDMPPPPTPCTKSNFFVYCSTCDDLKEGKLRVRCSKCLSGAFTVGSHPQGWDDVLIPRQVCSQ